MSTPTRQAALQRAGSAQGAQTRPDAGCRAARHGSYVAYSYWGCRCAAGREAARVYHKRLREHRNEPGTVDPTGTIRRLQALAALGWPQPELARLLGCHPRALGQLGRRSQMVHAGTARNVAVLYDELSMRIGPSQRARNRASTLGYIPPLGWAEGTIDDPHARPAPASERHAGRDVDPVVIQRIRDGEPPARVTWAERHATVSAMTHSGNTAAAIAERIGITPRSVTRVRTHHTAGGLIGSTAAS